MNVATYSSYGLMAPKGTSSAIMDYLYQQVVEVQKDRGMKEALDGQGVQGVAIPAAELERSLAEETRLWSRVVREAKIKVE